MHFEYQQATITGDWGQENALGSQYADEIIVAMRDGENPAILGHATKILTETAWNGFHVGFFHRISEHLIHGGVIP